MHEFEQDALELPVSPVSPLPQSFLAYLPYIWSRVLFAGHARSAERVRGRALLFLLIVPGALLYPCLSFLLFEPDEGRYAEIPREMLVRGEWVVAYLQGAPYIDKPPAFYCLWRWGTRSLVGHDGAW